MEIEGLLIGAVFGRSIKPAFHNRRVLQTVLQPLHKHRMSVHDIKGGAIAGRTWYSSTISTLPLIATTHDAKSEYWVTRASAHDTYALSRPQAHNFAQTHRLRLMNMARLNSGRQRRERCSLTTWGVWRQAGEPIEGDEELKIIFCHEPESCQGFWFLESGKKDGMEAAMKVTEILT